MLTKIWNFILRYVSFVKVILATLTTIVLAVICYPTTYLFAIVMMAALVSAVTLLLDLGVLGSATGNLTKEQLWFCKVIPSAIMFLELIILGFLAVWWLGALMILVALGVWYWHYNPAYRKLN